MLKLSRSINLIIALIIPLYTNETYAQVVVKTASQIDVLAEYRSSADLHGLYEIREAARTFLKPRRSKDGHAWDAFGPDIRFMFPRCREPLQSRWAKASERQGHERGVIVTCRRAVTSPKQWSALILVQSAAEANQDVLARYRTDHRVHGLYEIRSAAVEFVESQTALVSSVA